MKEGSPWISLRIILLSLMIILLEDSCAEISSAEDEQLTETAASSANGFINAQFLGRYPWLYMLSFPSLEEIEELKVEWAEEFAFGLCMPKLEMVFQEACLPQDIAQNLIPLRGYVSPRSEETGQGSDAFVTRFTIQDMEVHLVVTSANIRLAVRRKFANKGATTSEVVEYVRGIIAILFQDHEKILCNAWQLSGDTSALVGEMQGASNKLEQSNVDPLANIKWYESLKWWASGNTVCFKISTCLGTTWGIVDQKYWFALVRAQSMSPHTKGIFPPEKSLQDYYRSNIGNSTVELGH